MKKILIISLIFLSSCATVYIKPTYTGITQQTTKTKKKNSITELLIIGLSIQIYLFKNKIL